MTSLFLFVILAVSPNLISVEELIEAEKGVYNMALAHEIVVDESFIMKQRDLPESRYLLSIEQKLFIL